MVYMVPWTYSYTLLVVLRTTAYNAGNEKPAAAFGAAKQEKGRKKVEIAAKIHRR